MNYFELFVIFLAFCAHNGNGQRQLARIDIDQLKRENTQFQPFDRETISQLSKYPDSIYSGFMLEDFLDLSDKCLQDMSQVVKDLNSSTDYTLRMLDSMGKPGAGILDGNFVWYGSFEQCKAVSDNPTRPEGFSSGYCLPTIQILFLSFRFGVCVPNSCNETDVQNVMEKFLGQVFSTGWSVPDVLCVQPVPWRAEDTAMVCVTAFFGLLVACSTGYEIYRRSKAKSAKRSDGLDNIGFETGEEKTNGIQLNGIQTIESNGKLSEESNGVTVVNGTTPNGAHYQGKEGQKKNDTKSELLGSFSILSNIDKMVNMTSTPKGMESLNGMRVLSMAWVLLGHAYIGTYTFASNLGEILVKWSQSMTFQFVYQGPLAVDTFFFISGFLVAFGTLKILKKTRGRLNWAMFYLNRYLRLTPIYMFVLFLWTTLVMHMIRGPYEDKRMLDVYGFGFCEKYWWTYLLYINNFYPGLSESCMGWSWYLANDMQFYIISPIFVYALYKNKIVGHSLISAGILSNLLAVGIIYNKYRLGDVLDASVDSATKETYTNNMYVRPYYRIAPYLVGIACADIYMRTKDNVSNMKATWWKVVVVLAWMVAIAVNWTLLYGLHPYDSNALEMRPVWLQELYWSTFRLVWAATCAWVAYACLTGWGGFINSILSLKIWEPMTRLCYLTYLLHPAVIAVIEFNMQQNLRFNHWIMGLFFAGLVAITFAVAIVLFLLVEQPLGRLQKYFFKK